MEEAMTVNQSDPGGYSEGGNPEGGARTEGAQSLSEVGERAKEVVRAKAEEAKAGLGEARHAAERQAEATIDHAAEEVSRTARALEDAASGMEGGTPQTLLREASRGLTRFADTMRGRSMSELVGEVSDFGRRNPAAFLGAAALAGFALARFGVASESGAERDYARDYERDYGGRDNG
jgi:hypothetical protein